MKTRNFPTRTLAAVAAVVLALTVSTALAQDSTATYNSQPVQQPVKLSSPQLSYGVSEVVKLAQAKASDETVLAYVKNSGTSYGLDADQIIYLQQQGVSSAVITAMLNQPKVASLQQPQSAPQSYAPAIPQPTTPAPAPQPDNSAAAAQAPANVTYVQNTPVQSYYYSDPGYYSSYYPYSYPYYGGYYGYGYPVVGFGWGWGGGYYRGGWRGGGSWGGGGWHGGGGGWHGGGGWGGGGGGHGGGHR